MSRAKRRLLPPLPEQCIEALERRLMLSAVAQKPGHHAVSAAAALAKPTFVTFKSHRTNKPLQSSSPMGYTPAQIQQAYGINKILLGSVTGDGSGQTVAIIDAYNDPTIVTDLATFDSTLGLPDTTSAQVSANVLSVVNQTGGSSLPAVDRTDPKGDDWEVEESLDVEWVHAIAPGAKILLVECKSAANANLYAGVDYAKSVAGVAAVSMSWGGTESYNESTSDSTFTSLSGHGVTFVASTGDNAQPAEYPSVSPNVVAAGGTSLSIDGSADYQSESAWNDGGGGVSTYELQPVFQNNVVTQNQTYRTAPDISFDADPNTGVAICDSYDYGSSTPWTQIGGTSVSAPCLSALIAIADQGRSIAGLSSLDGPTQTLPAIYNLPAADFNDVTTGNNGFAAGPGYDLATGRGSPIANLFVQGLVSNPAGPYVAGSTQPTSDVGPISSISVNFNQGMDPSSFSVAAGVDSFTGPGNANLLSQISGFAWSNSNQTLTVDFTPVTGNGTYSMVIGPDIKSAGSEQEMDQNFDGVAGEATDTYTARFYITTSVGPDSYGYAATPYPYENLSLTPGASGVTSILANTDDSSAAVNLGTNSFNFYGTTYTGNTSMYADTNGFVALGGASAINTEYANDDLSSDPTQASIAPLWDDWATEYSGAQQVLYEFRDPNSSGVMQELVIEWDQVANQGAEAAGYNTTATFELILQINTGSTPGTILFNYSSLNLNDADFSNGASATVGIKNSGTQGPGAQTLLVSMDNPANPLVASGEAIRIGATPPPSVAGQNIFYYGSSAFDGGDTTPNPIVDAGAIATDKTALLPSNTAAFANYTSYVDGINGVMVDLAGGPPTTLSLADFSFAVGNSNTPSSWAAAPAPTSMTVTPGGGVNGSERVEFVWANNAIQDQWLQVTVAADSDTGLASPYVFYFGNAIGSTGDNPSSAAVGAADVLLTRNAFSGLGSAGITNDYDFNRDGRVTAQDVLIARNGFSGLSPLKLITVPASSSASLLVVSQGTMVAAPSGSSPAAPAGVQAIAPKVAPVTVPKIAPAVPVLSVPASPVVNLRIQLPVPWIPSMPLGQILAGDNGTELLNVLNGPVAGLGGSKNPLI